MTQPTYPAARTVAATVVAHLARQPARPSAEDDAAAPPDAATVQALVDAAFWASLRREEGRTPRISLAWLSPGDARHPLVFGEPLPLAPDMLAKIAPAVERPGVHLGVWRATQPGQWQVWGTTRDVPARCLVIEVVTSGLIVIKQRSEPFGKFVNIAVLEGDQIKVVDPRGGALVDPAQVATSPLGAFEQVSFGFNDVLVQIAASMRAHGRGGALLVVPAQSDHWLESLVRPVLYAVHPPFAELAHLVRRRQNDSEWRDDLRQAVDAVAGLTAVDGATVISDQYDVLAFGAKVRRRRGSPPVEEVLVTEPVAGSLSTRLTPAQLGGTRHLSAAQFVHDHRDATALVASQDGRFTIFAWSSRFDAVHAHRVDALLL